MEILANSTIRFLDGGGKGLLRQAVMTNQHKKERVQSQALIMLILDGLKYMNIWAWKLNWFI